MTSLSTSIAWWRDPDSGVPIVWWEYYDDFRKFLWLVWDHLGLPDPTHIQYQIARFLQTGPARSIVEAFRGVGKTWVTVAFACWNFLRNPQTKILVVSATKLFADQFTTFARRLINEMPILAHLKPQHGQRDTQIAFDVGPATAAHAPSLKSVGITGQITGSRANLIIGDDVEVLNNSLTVSLRMKLAEIVKEFDNLISPGGRIVYLGTPQTEDSLYLKLAQRGYLIRIWPARYPNAALVAVYGARLAPEIARELTDDPHLVGRPTDPLRFTEFDLIEREASIGRSTFALQFMLDTSLSDESRYPLKLRDLIVMDLQPDIAPERPIWAGAPEFTITDLQSVGMHDDRFMRPMQLLGTFIPYQASTMAIDPKGRGTDELGVTVAKLLNSRIYVPLCTGLAGGYDEETLIKLAEMAKEFKVNKIVVESNFGDGMFVALFAPILARIYPVTVEEVRHNIQKEKRIIDTLEPVMNQHRLVIDRGVVQRDLKSTEHLPPEIGLQYQLFYQLTRITRERGALNKDDRLDSLAMAVADLVGMMGADVEQQMAQLREEMLQRELDKVLSAIKAGNAIVLGTHLPVSTPQTFLRGR